MVEYNKLITRDFSPSTKVVPWESEEMEAYRYEKIK